MKLTRSLVAVLASAALLATLAPAFASAQSVPQSVDCSPTQNNWWNFWSGANSTNCVQGQVLVYVQPLGQTTNGPVENPSDFTVDISAQDASVSSLPGSLSGTPVWVTGSYTITAQPMNGYEPSYSQGCTGNVINNEQATCIVTESATAGYYNSATPYPYSYQPVPFTCSASQPTVALGQSVTFTAQGGDVSGPYNWQFSGRSYYSNGSTLTVTMQNTGTQLVTVTHNAQTANCSINVAASGYYPAPVSTISPAVPINPINPGGPIVGVGPGVYVTPTYLPALPDTGFEPMSSTGVAYAIVALIAAALMVLPYVRQAFAALLG